MFVSHHSNHHFLLPPPAQPITGQQSAVRAVAKFDFTAESEDELTLKVCLSHESMFSVL